jgi:tRNA pseudouridine38-40 synthase
MRLALIVEYEGTCYRGFQFQSNAPSVQEELERAIARFTGEASRVKGAGRTDAGVHAKGQVVAFDTNAAHSPQTFVRALNFYLPDDIAVKRAFQTHGDFDPRRMARSRRYRYTIDCGTTPSPLSRRTAYHVGEPLNVRRMRVTAQHLVGKHDFARFAGPLKVPNSGTVREIYEAKVRQHRDIINFEVEGSSFLPHQVRRMAGALVDVGRGSLTPTDFKSMIAGGPGDAVAHSLPPQGLCLMEVTYAEFPPKIGESDDIIR